MSGAAAQKYGTLLFIVITISAFLRAAHAETTTEGPTTTQEPPVTWFECPDQYSYHPHPQNCTQYLICVFGKPYLRACGGGLNWNDQLKICDWPNPRTTCQQIDENTAYRPMNSPTVTDPPMPASSDSQSDPYGGLESSGLQNFKPDEDAAKSQLTQYAGKRVVYFEAPKDGRVGEPSNESSPTNSHNQAQNPQDQRDQSQRTSSDQGQSQSPSASTWNNQDDVIPIGQIPDSSRSSAKPPGKPLGISSWDTGNDDYPSQQPRPAPSQSQSNDDHQSSNQQQSAPSPKSPKGPPLPEIPHGNPPPWIAMALAKKNQRGGSPQAPPPPPPSPPMTKKSQWDSDDDPQQQSQYQQIPPPIKSTNQANPDSQMNPPPTRPPAPRPTPSPNRPTFAPVPPRKTAPPVSSSSNSDDSRSPLQSYMKKDRYPNEPPRQGGQGQGQQNKSPSFAGRPNAFSLERPQSPIRIEPQTYQMPEDSDDQVDKYISPTLDGPSSKYGRPAPQQIASRPVAVNRRPSPSALSQFDSPNRNSQDADQQDQNDERPTRPNVDRRMRPNQSQFSAAPTDNDQRGESGNSPRNRQPTLVGGKNRPPVNQQTSSSQPDNDSKPSRFPGAGLQNPGFMQQPQRRPPPQDVPVPVVVQQPQRRPSSQDVSQSRGSQTQQRQRFPGQVAPPARQPNPWESNNSQSPFGSADLDDQQPAWNPSGSSRGRPAGNGSPSSAVADFDLDQQAPSNIEIPNSQFLFSSNGQSPTTNQRNRQQSTVEDDSSQRQGSADSNSNSGDDSQQQFPSRPMRFTGLDSVGSASSGRFPGRPGLSSSGFSRKQNSKQQSSSSNNFATGDRTVQDQINQLRQESFPSFGDTNWGQSGSGSVGSGSNQDGSRQSGLGDGQQDREASSDSQLDFGPGNGFSNSQQERSNGRRAPSRDMARLSGDTHDEDHEQPASSNFDFQRFYVGV